MNERRKALNEIENAHRIVGGTGPGRRVATQQINYAYTVLLSSQFQGFCRDLHDECVKHLVQSVVPVALQNAFEEALRLNRRLDRGNPNPGNIGSDFGRFKIAFWREAHALDVRSSSRREQLEDLNELRNAIAHQDPKVLALRPLHLRQVREWRRACENLASRFDEVMRSHIESVMGASPW